MRSATQKWASDKTIKALTYKQARARPICVELQRHENKRYLGWTTVSFDKNSYRKTKKYLIITYCFVSRVSPKAKLISSVVVLHATE